MKTWFSALACGMLVCGMNLRAQHFRWETPVNPVVTGGYTKIFLPPEVTSQTKDPFMDIRIYDSDSVQAPFLGAYDKVLRDSVVFVEYPIVDKRDMPGNSWIIVENPVRTTSGATEQLNNLVLQFNNADAKRRMTLTGSYNQSDWYALKDEYVIMAIHANVDSSSSSYIRFDFPYSDYKYYRFSFDNWSDWWKDYSAPLFVVRAGVFEHATLGSVMDNIFSLPGVTVTQSDDKQRKESVVDITFADSQFVDYISFDLITQNPSGKFFRGANLYKIDDNGDPKNTNTALLLPWSSTVLSADRNNIMPVHGHKVKHLVLRISNGDDSPLYVDSVHALQVKRYLLAYLVPDQKYFLRFGNDTVGYPSYDMRYVEDSLSMHEMPVITVGPRKHLPDAPAPVIDAGVNSIFQDRRAIWGAIVLVVLILGLMSVKMLREMK